MILIDELEMMNKLFTKSLAELLSSGKGDKYLNWSTYFCVYLITLVPSALRRPVERIQVNTLFWIIYITAKKTMKTPFDAFPHKIGPISEWNLILN